MLKKLNVKKVCRKTLEEEKVKIVKTINESDLDHDNYVDELDKIERINKILDNEKKSKIDPSIIVAIISAASTITMFAGFLVYENREVIHAKTAARIMEKGVKLK